MPLEPYEASVSSSSQHARPSIVSVGADCGHAALLMHARRISRSKKTHNSRHRASGYYCSARANASSACISHRHRARTMGAWSPSPRERLARRGWRAQSSRRARACAKPPLQFNAQTHITRSVSVPESQHPCARRARRGGNGCRRGRGTSARPRSVAHLRPHLHARTAALRACCLTSTSRAPAEPGHGQRRCSPARMRAESTPASWPSRNCRNLRLRRTPFRNMWAVRCNRAHLRGSNPMGTAPRSPAHSLPQTRLSRRRSRTKRSY